MRSIVLSRRADPEGEAQRLGDVREYLTQDPGLQRVRVSKGDLTALFDSMRDLTMRLEDVERRLNALEGGGEQR